MRVLQFILDKDGLRKKEGCDFSNIPKGTTNFIKLQFLCSYEFQNEAKACMIESISQGEYVPVVNNECIIPDKFAISSEIEIQVITKVNNVLFKTNKVKIRQV